MTWWGTPTEVRATQELPVLGEVAIDLVVSGETATETPPSALAEGIRTLYEQGLLCDVVLQCADERFPAHSAMLAAMSQRFSSFLLSSAVSPEGAAGDPMEGMLSVRLRDPPPAAVVAGEPLPPPPPPPTPSELQVPPVAEGGEPLPPPPPPPTPSEQHIPPVAEGGAGDAIDTVNSAKDQPLELQVNGITCPGALKILLDYIYYVGTGSQWEYDPASAEVNKDVLRLARRFVLQNLHERAARWVATGVTTTNIVDRLVTCLEFGLDKLRERIMDSLIANPAELAVVSGSLEIMKHPRLLQDLLVQVASVCRAGPPQPRDEVVDDQEKIVDKPDAKRRKKNM